MNGFRHLFEVIRDVAFSSCKLSPEDERLVRWSNVYLTDGSIKADMTVAGRRLGAERTLGSQLDL